MYVISGSPNITLWELGEVKDPFPRFNERDVYIAGLQSFNLWFLIKSPYGCVHNLPNRNFDDFVR
jgi:hypothetical protein